MAKNSELTKDERKRLDSANKEWVNGSSYLDKITISDLRLLLENFEPLQDLIRAIVEVRPTAPQGTENTRATTVTPQSTPSALTQKIERLEQAVGAMQEERDAALAQKNQYSAALEQAQQRNVQLEQAQSECNAAAQKLLNKNKELQQDKKRLEQALQQAELKTADYQQQFKRVGQVPPELALLRQDAELAQRLGLSTLPENDAQALIQMVAVLSQRDSLERLWGILKDRCESQSRAAHADELRLLDASLTWFNYNWATHPWQRVDISPGTSYNYEKHLRSKHTATGEDVRVMLLPGIANSNNNVVCKTLVATF